MIIGLLKSKWKGTFSKGGFFWSVCARVSGLSRDQDKAGGVDYIDDIARRKEVDLCHEHSLHSQSVIQSHMMSNFSLSWFH